MSKAFICNTCGDVVDDPENGRTVMVGEGLSDYPEGVSVLDAPEIRHFCGDCWPSDADEKDAHWFAKLVDAVTRPAD